MKVWPIISFCACLVLMSCGPVVTVEQAVGDLSGEVKSGQTLSDSKVTFTGQVYDANTQIVTSYYAIPRDPEPQKKQVTMGEKGSFTIEIPLRSDPACVTEDCLTMNTIYVGVDQPAGRDKYVRFNFLRLPEVEVETEAEDEAEEEIEGETEEETLEEVEEEEG